MFRVERFINKSSCLLPFSQSTLDRKYTTIYVEPSGRQSSINMLSYNNILNKFN